MYRFYLKRLVKVIYFRKICTVNRKILTVENHLSQIE